MKKLSLFQQETLSLYAEPFEQIELLKVNKTPQPEFTTPPDYTELQDERENGTPTGTRFSLGDLVRNGLEKGRITTDEKTELYYKMMKKLYRFTPTGESHRRYITELDLILIEPTTQDEPNNVSNGLQCILIG